MHATQVSACTLVTLYTYLDYLKHLLHKLATSQFIKTVYPWLVLYLNTFIKDILDSPTMIVFLFESNHRNGEYISLHVIH